MKKRAKPRVKNKNSDEVRYKNELVHADITLKSASGESIHSKKAEITSQTVHRYYPPDKVMDIVMDILKRMGVRVISHDRITISIAVPVKDFIKIFNIKKGLTTKKFFPYTVPRKQRVPDSKGCGIDVFYRGGKELPMLPQIQEYVEVIRLATPAKFCQNADPPTPGYFHLKVPDDVARLVDAIQCHHRGISGNNVVLAMPDQGTFDHPYYTSRGYNITLDDSAYDETADTGSHGTAIAANALAIAPNSNFIGIRNGKKVTSGIAAFNQSVAHNPDVISISWGITTNNAELRSAISQAIADGITVCCACGNGGDVVFPSSMPEVISVGGSYAQNDDDLEAATYASSGILSGVDNGRQMPDITGLVGQEPNGIYITLPCHPGSDEDKAFGGGTFPDDDETTKSDGWLVASGTSSATPQVAAAACMLIQKDPGLFKGNPAAIKQRLLETALDVTQGSSSSGETAGQGVDNATGVGLLDAYIAINRVDAWVRSNDKDRGLVPVKGAHYVSPDIKVLASPLSNPETGFHGALHINRPIYGTKYYVYIRARNRGVDPANNLTVGFYYADPSTFNQFPDDWLDGQSGNQAQGTVTVDGLPTNIFSVPQIPANSARTAGPFVWEPPQPTSATQVSTDLDGKKGGHFCLLTRIECATDPICWIGGAQATVVMDNNIGMKNLWVVEPDMTFPLIFRGIPEFKKHTHIEIDTSSLLKGMSFGICFPKKWVRFLNVSREQLKIIPLRDQRGLVFAEIPSGRIIQAEIIGYEKIPTRVWITAKKKIEINQKILRLQKAPVVHIIQYVGHKAVGGAAFALGKYPWRKGKKQIAELFVKKRTGQKQMLKKRKKI